MKKNIKLATFLFLATLSQSSLLNASNTASSNLLVSAVVASSCNISQATLAFGSYDPAGSNYETPLQTNGNIDIRCTRNTNATITLDRGMHAANAHGTHRAMVNANNNSYLNYDIYTNSSYTNPWTDTNSMSYTANSSEQTTIKIYAIIPAKQEVSDGAYQDTVTINAVF